MQALETVELVVSAAQQRRQGGAATKMQSLEQCSPSPEAALMREKEGERGEEGQKRRLSRTMDILDGRGRTTGHHPLGFFKALLGKHSAFSQEELYKYPLEELKAKILHSKRVRLAIRERAASCSVPRSVVYGEVERMLGRLCADFCSPALLQITANVVDSTLMQFYETVNVPEEDIAMLRKVSEEAQREGKSILYLPCHKSHLDYIVLAFMFYRLGIRMPHIAAGDNLLLPVIGAFLRNCGAFFIRRKFSPDDIVYKSVVHSYIETLIGAGQDIEFFLEGGRSRTGKLLRPKLGLIKMLLSSMLEPEDGVKRDALIVPVSIGYDKVYESSSYVFELMGGRKKKESIAGVASQLFHIMQSPLLGKITVRFAPAFSVQDYLKDQVARRAQFSPLLSPAHRDQLATKLCYKVLEEINRFSPVSGTQIVAAILLTIVPRGITRAKLIHRAEWLREEICKNGGDLSFPEDLDMAVLVDVSIRVLDGLVQTVVTDTEPILVPLRHFELSYYRNGLIHLFTDQAIIALSLYSFFKEDRTLKQVSLAQLIPRVRFLSVILRGEFVYAQSTEEGEREGETEHGRESDVLVANVHRGLTKLKERSQLNVTEDVISIPSEEFSGWGLYMQFLCMLLWPFVESYWVAGLGLLFHRRNNPNGISESALVKELQQLSSSLYYVGHLQFHDAISGDALSNAINEYVEMGIIERVDGKLFVTSRYSDGVRMKELVEQMGSFRSQPRGLDGEELKNILSAKMGKNSQDLSSQSKL